MKKKLISILMSLVLVSGVLIGCGGQEEPTDTVSETSEDQASDDSSSSTAGDSVLKKGDYVIGLSNSYFGNTWRKQMVDAFTNAAEAAKEAGYISDYEIQNGDNTVNSQIAQINSFILDGVDAICICAASPTALNSTIQKALDAGITVVAFDSIVDLDGVYTMDYPGNRSVRTV